MEVAFGWELAVPGLFADGSGSGGMRELGGRAVVCALAEREDGQEISSVVGVGVGVRGARGYDDALFVGNAIGRNRANCAGCGSRWDREKTAPTGSFAANGFGLHDMHGNVLEWVGDCWNAGYAGAPSDGRAWESGICARRVLRGGAWGNVPGSLRAAYRYRSDTGDRSYDDGFRVARTLTP